MLTFRGIALLLLALLWCATCSARMNDVAAPGIVINIPSRTLELYSADTLIKVYPIAVGKPSTPSPLGNYHIFEKEVNPWWFPPRTGEVVPSGPANPLGYRWMGFAPMYGIHGTNAPWAIGMAVSNGCIRMHEEDVEELFEVVPYGTPVRITYERVKVQVDGQGQASVGVYPDIYGYGGGTLIEAKRKMTAFGLGGLLDDGELGRLINEEAERQIVFARIHNIKVNGKMLTDRAVTVKEVLYVPVWPVAGALGVNVAWDEARMLVRGERHAVPGTVKGDRIYVLATDAKRLFGGQQAFLPEENSVEINRLALFLNGRPLAADVQMVGEVMAVPLLPLAQAVGQKVTANAEGAPLVHGKPVPFTMVGEEQYIKITDIFDVFRAYVYWNQQARTVELTYPFKVTGGSD